MGQVYNTALPPQLPVVQILGNSNNIPYLHTPTQPNPQQFHYPFVPFPYNNMYRPSPNLQHTFFPIQPLHKIINHSNMPPHTFAQLQMERPILNASGGKLQEKYKRKCYSKKMVQRLEAVYKEERFISQAVKEDLSKELGLTCRQVKVWFQNRRMKDKKVIQ